MDLQLNLNAETVSRADVVTSPPCVEPSATIGQVLELLKAQRTGCALVCRDDRLLGIFTERDALKLMAKDTDWDRPIEEVMVTQPETVSSTSTVGQAVAKMSTGGFRRLPIVEDGNRPVGLLKVSSILHYLVEHFPNVVYTLPPAPHHTTQEREGA